MGIIYLAIPPKLARTFRALSSFQKLMTSFKGNKDVDRFRRRIHCAPDPAPLRMKENKKQLMQVGEPKYY